MTDEQITTQIATLENKKREINLEDYSSPREAFAAMDSIDKEIAELRAHYSTEKRWDKAAQELKRRGYLPHGETFN